MTTFVKRTETEAVWWLNYDLTGCTIVIKARSEGGTVTTLTSSIVNALTGQVSATVSALAVGTYDVEFTVTATATSKKAIWPSVGYEQMIISAEIT